MISFINSFTFIFICSFGTIPTRETAVPNSSPESERKRSPLLYSFAVPDRTLRTLSSQFRQSIPCDIFEEMVA